MKLSTVFRSSKQPAPPPTERQTVEATTTAEGLALGGVLLLALAVRLWNLTSQSLSNDEVLDIEIAVQPLGEILRTADSFPPLHHLLLRSAFELGLSDMAGRWLSLVYGIGAVFAVARLGRVVGGPRCGLLAGGLFAVWPAAVYFSQEGRAYSLYLLVAASTVWLFFRALYLNSRRAWLAFAVAAAVSGYAHYYMAFVQVAVLIVWLTHCREPAVLRRGFAGFATMAALQLPVLWLASYDLGFYETFRLRIDFGFAAIAFTGWTFLAGYCLGPSLPELHVLTLREVLPQVIVWAALLLASLGILAVRLVKYGGRPAADLAVVFATPFALAVAATLGLGVAYNVRYIVACVVSLVALISLAITKGPQTVASIAALTILLVATVTSLVNRHVDERYHYEDIRSTVEYLHRLDDEAPIYTMSHYMRAPVNHYLSDGRIAVPLTIVEPGGENLDEVLAEIIPGDGQPRYWIVYSREFHGDPEGLFLERLLDEGAIELEAQWTGVRLYRGVK